MVSIDLFKYYSYYIKLGCFESFYPLIKIDKSGSVSRKYPTKFLTYLNY